MRTFLRRFSILAVLATLALPLDVVAAGAAVGKPYQAKMSADFAADMSSRPAAAPYGAFVSFRRDVPHDEQLRFLESRGLIVVSDLHSIDTFFVSGTVAAFRAMRGERAVTYMQKSQQRRLLGETGTWSTGARVARQPAGGGPHRDGAGRIVDGTGIGVAVVDGGIYGPHPDLTNRMARNFKLVCPDPGVVSTSLANPCGVKIVYQEQEDSDTSSGHGTHVAGIVAGDGTASQGTQDRTYVGVAPGARLFGFGVGDGNSINTYLAADAFQWVIDNGAAQTPPIKIVTNSWGCFTTDGGCAYDPSDPINQLATELVEVGVTVLFAAGNDGGDGTTVCYTGGAGDCTSDSSKNPTPGVISVANYNDANTGKKNNTLSTSSSRGSAQTARFATWPDISAPGSTIASTCKPGTAACATGQQTTSDDWAPNYAVLSGTSMATPHVAAAAALLLQANAALTPAQVEDILQDTARKFPGGTTAPGAYVADPQNPGGTSPYDQGAGTSSYDKGAGLLDIPAALQVVGAVRDGFARNGMPTVTISSPASNSEVGNVVPVSGAAFDGSLNPNTPSTLADGDAGDYPGPGAGDLESVSVIAGTTGVTYTVKVKDVTDVGPEGLINPHIAQNVNGVASSSEVDITATGVEPAPFNATFNNAPPTSASMNTTDDTVTFFVPYAALGNPPANSVAHNVSVWAYVNGLRNDVMPGGNTSDLGTKTQFAKPYTVNPVQDPAPGASVKLSVDGGPETAATVNGSSPSYTWSGSVSLTGAAQGSHEIAARLYLNGVPRATTTQTVIVGPDGNSPPVADAQSVTLAEEGTQTITLTGSDTDAEPLTYKITSLPAKGTLHDGPTSLDPVVGAVPFTLTSDQVTYAGATDAFGADAFAFVVNDSHVDSAAATVSVTITGVNDLPSASDQSVSTPEDTPETITLTGTDVDGDALGFVVLTLPANGALHDGTTTGAPQITTVPYTLASNKATYAPGANYTGPDAFTFKANDGQGDSLDTGTVSITVGAVSDPPVANSQSASVNEDSSTAITLTGSDPDGSPVTFRITSLPVNGTLYDGVTQVTSAPFVLTANAVTYTPDADYNGADAFNFRTHDGTQDSAPATVSLTIAPVNDAPSAQAQSVTATVGAAKTITLAGTDVDGTQPSFEIASLPGNGTLYDGTTTGAPQITTVPFALVSDEVTYLPNPGYEGADSFTFVATDGALDSSAATVSISVQPGDILAPAPPHIASPSNGNVKPKSFAISGTAEAGSTVRLYRDGQLGAFATATAAANNTWNVSVSNLSDGSHTIQATATDAALNTSGFSNLVTFTVDAINPSVSVGSPYNGQVYLPAQPVVVSGTATDNRGLDRVVVRYRNAQTGSTVRQVNATCGGGACTGTSVSWSDMPSLGLGHYDVTAIAYDAAGNFVGTMLVGFIVIGI